MDDACIVVGDEYGEFSGNRGVTTYSEIWARIDKGEIGAAGMELLFGLGVGLIDGRALMQLVESRGAPVRVRRASEPADLALTHKRELDHVLITKPVAIGPHHYSTDVILGNDADRLSDHVTGQHIGGMLLIEAARQTVIAALEIEYSDHAMGPWGISWSKLVADFTAFAFPLPTTIAVRLEELEAKRTSNVSVTLRLGVTQAGATVANLEFATMLIPRESLRQIERRRATKAIEHVLPSPAEAPEAAPAPAARTA